MENIIMKKLLAIFLALVCVLSICSCGASENYVTTQFTRVDGDGNKTLIEYDENGDRKDTKYDENGNVLGETEYANGGGIKSETFYDENGNVSYIIEYEDDHMKKWTSYYFDGVREETEYAVSEGKPIKVKSTTYAPDNSVWRI